MFKQWVLVGIAAALFPVVSSAQKCTAKEYAEYKDEALTDLGRHSLAFEYCRAEMRADTAGKMADLAIQHNRGRDAKEAMAIIAQCRAEQSKISNALVAAKANKTIAFMRSSCTAPYKIGDK